MSTLRRQVGAMVRHHRERAGLTQAELGDLVGKTLETIGRIERGTHAPSLLLLEKLAEALKLDPRELMGPGSYKGSAKHVPPFARVVDHLAGLSDADIERAEKLLGVAMGWKVVD